ncbi:MAG: hypothetical protein JXB30_13235 [Anaerolineae bacterium]|nr:hypothetical protein [Anaerolineae bacterium]
MPSTTSDSIPLNERRRVEDPEPFIVDACDRSYRRYKQHDGSLNRFLWAGLLIFVGLVLLANRTGMLPQVASADTRDWIMLGIGGLLLSSAFVRAVSEGYKQSSKGRIIIGLVLTGLGISAIFGVSSTLLWPAALIIVGFYLLLRNLAYY